MSGASVDQQLRRKLLEGERPPVPKAAGREVSGRSGKGRGRGRGQQQQSAPVSKADPPSKGSGKPLVAAGEANSVQGSVPPAKGVRKGTTQDLVTKYRLLELKASANESSSGTAIAPTGSTVDSKAGLALSGDQCPEVVQLTAHVHAREDAACEIVSGGSTGDLQASTPAAASPSLQPVKQNSRKDLLSGSPSTRPLPRSDYTAATPQPLRPITAALPPGLESHSASDSDSEEFSPCCTQPQGLISALCTPLSAMSIQCPSTQARQRSFRHSPSDLPTERDSPMSVSPCGAPGGGSASPTPTRHPFGLRALQRASSRRVRGSRLSQQVLAADGGGLGSNDEFMEGLEETQTPLTVPATPSSQGLPGSGAAPMSLSASPRAARRAGYHGPQLHLDLSIDDSPDSSPGPTATIVPAAAALHLLNHPRPSITAPAREAEFQREASPISFLDTLPASNDGMIVVAAEPSRESSPEARGSDGQCPEPQLWPAGAGQQNESPAADLPHIAVSSNSAAQEPPASTRQTAFLAASPVATVAAAIDSDSFQLRGWCQGALPQPASPPQRAAAESEEVRQHQQEQAEAVRRAAEEYMRAVARINGQGRSDPAPGACPSAAPEHPPAPEHPAAAQRRVPRPNPQPPPAAPLQPAAQPPVPLPATAVPWPQLPPQGFHLEHPLMAGPSAPTRQQHQQQPGCPPLHDPPCPPGATAQDGGSVLDYVSAMYAALGRAPPPPTASALIVGPPPADSSEVPRRSGSAGAGSAAESSSGVCRRFVWQKDALAFADQCNEEAAVGGGRDPGEGRSCGEASTSGRPPEVVKVFCEEHKSGTGYSRHFLAASYPALWARYMAQDPHRRHLYEVIREARPCHLYFDLEYLRECNGVVNGNGLVDHLIQLVRDELRRRWGLALPDLAILELDSSTAAKFSRHLLLRLPGRAFRSNADAGAFVAALMALPEASALTVRKESGGFVQQYTSIVDTAVYTKNRHFRVLWSSKGGKAAHLVPSARYATAAGQMPSETELFLASLVCNVDSSAALLEVETHKFRPLPRTKHGGPAAAAAGHSSGAAQDAWQPAVKVAFKHDENEAPSALSTEQLLAFGKRAVPFVERIAAQRAGGAPATVRTLAPCGYDGRVAFSMLGPGSHFCENIGRCHQSNHVFFVLDFVQGVYAQKCHDPDCCNFRSSWMPLPRDLQLK